MSARRKPAPDPVAEFLALLERAKRSEAADATAFSLATVAADGRPAARMVLLKAAGEDGFVFYTNYGSRKARELEARPEAAMCFYWSSIDTQVRIEGTVERVSAAESDAYFATRSRRSQLGAWASRQSEPLESRRTLVTGFLKLQARFAGRPVPRPDFWGGYRLRPERIEIWFNQLHRLHDRFLYTRTAGGWSVERLYP